MELPETDAWVHNFRRQGEWWVFHWRCLDFWRCLAALKEMVPPEDRDWNENTQEWCVRCGPYDEKLAGLFRNWASHVQMIKDQLPLPLFT